MAKKVQIEILLDFDRFEESGQIGYEVIVNNNHFTKDKFKCPYCTETIDVKFSLLEEHLTETFNESELELTRENVNNIGILTSDSLDNSMQICRDISENTDVLKESLLNELYDFEVTNTPSLESFQQKTYEDENDDNVSVISLSDSDETCSTVSLLNLKYQKEIEDAIESMQINTLDECSLISFIEGNAIVDNAQDDVQDDQEKYSEVNKFQQPLDTLNSVSNDELSKPTDPDSSKPSEEDNTEVPEQNQTFHLCPCKRVYKLKKYFLKHMRQYHPDFALNDCETFDTELVENGIVPKSREGRPIHRCNVCEKVYWSRRSYRRHMVCCHPEEAKRLNLRAKTYHCQYCEKIYFTSELLNQHLLLHVNPDHYLCSYCRKSFATHNNLKRHINAVHLRIKSYICEVCGVRFNQRYSLRLHHQELHGTNGRYICNDCGKSYGTKEKLRYHIKCTHHGYGKTVCKLCGKTFLINNYKRHLRDVHKEGRQLEYACRYCEKVFNRRAYRDIHECTHTGEKRFACKICNERFTDPGYRYAHMRRNHSSEFEKRKKRNINNNASKKCSET